MYSRQNILDSTLKSRAAFITARIETAPPMLYACIRLLKIGVWPSYCQRQTAVFGLRFHVTFLPTCGTFASGQPRPQGFSLKKWVGREKALASAGHMYSLNIPEKLIYMQPAGFVLTEGSNNGK